MTHVRRTLNTDIWAILRARAKGEAEQKLESSPQEEGSGPTQGSILGSRELALRDDDGEMDLPDSWNKDDSTPNDAVWRHPQVA